MEQMKWSITDHVCKACFGRLLVCRDEHGKLHVRCADCGLQADGSHKALCACGQKLNTGGDAGLRCRPNPNQGPDAPQEIIVEYVGVETGAGGRARGGKHTDYRESEEQACLWDE